MLETIEINPERRISACVIWLHGLGADGSDFVALLPQLGLSEEGVRFVFPHAPVRPVTINGGMRMRAWYDIRWPDLCRDVDDAAIRESAEAVTELIDREMVQIPLQRIALAGFSQGGAIALHTGLTLSASTAGILALSTYLAVPGVTGGKLVPAERATPIFMGHGTQDTVIPVALGEASRDQLAAAGYPVCFHRYSMGHALCTKEVRDIRNWLHLQLVGPEAG